MNFRKTLIATGLVFGVWQSQATAAPAQVPLFLTSGTESQVMINMSNDHQLFYKAYDDWSDLDPVPDGIPETTYKHAIDYFGYFDSNKCYDYDATANRFVPQAITVDKYCDVVSGAWSGNFLNWASMTRIDTVRKILFGGKRATDQNGLTVLERAYLPGDAHSFAKYYEESSLGEMAKLTPWNDAEITICNTTYAGTGVSENITAPPLLRVASGNFALWAANERYQCHWDNHGESQSNIFNSPNPNTNNGNDVAATGLDADADNPDWVADRLGLGDYHAFVEVCVAGLVGKEKCKEYPGPNQNLKPFGLLQQYGEGGEVHFGLLTGTYQRNKSGGTLRKNIGSIADEIDPASGIFTTPPATGSIIGSLNALRVSGYDHNQGLYNAQDNCAWGLDSFNDGSCTNWGNPQSEIYLEGLRYFAGLNATPAFVANDSAFISALVSASWTDPLNNDNYCAPVKVIQFNASVTSYDTDGLAGAADLNAIGSLSTWTNAVGTGEGIDGNQFFIGEGTGTTDQDGLCAAKSLSSLSDAEGLCPEAPRLEGGYDIAGLAYYARTESIRDDLTDADGNTADINVETYGVTLAPAVPKIEVPVPDSNQIVTILPACRNQTIGGNCAIVDFKVVQKHTEDPPDSGIYTGRFYVNWEDSEQGGDFDQDMAGVLSYAIDSDNITITTGVFADSTPNIMAFGYIVSGTEADGFHAHSGINGFNSYTDPTGVSTCGDAGIFCDTGEPLSQVVYAIGESEAKLLEAPLFYAAKWGGFKEEEEELRRPPNADEPNQIPDQNYEWDSDGDGLPNNYFFARNPGQLSEQLAALFETVAAVSSAASVVTNTVSLQTSTRIYQARFNSDFWSGGLLSFPVDMTTGALLPSEWDAGDVIAGQDYDDRVWLTWNTELEEGVAFRWDDNGTEADLDDDTTGLTEGQRNALNTNPETLLDDGLGPERLDYLRGDNSLEVSVSAQGTFRSRETPLGDVVHSSPTVVARPEFGYWDTLPGTNTVFESVPYSEFVTEFSESDCQNSDGTPITVWSAGTGGNAGGREPMVYFGANDGALHGVSACTGEERLAFVPASVYSNLSQLTSTDYEHRYFVDGSPTVVDAFFGGEWRTVLLGTLAAGGSSVFALDVTDPNDFRENNAHNVVLWEKNHGDADYLELGYTFSQPVVVKAQSYGWVAIFGNGYDSSAGKAVLYVARLSDGQLLTSIDVSSVDGLGSGPDNGLSTVSAIDRDSDGLVDLLYAGDLKGNVWRFEAPLTPARPGFSVGNTTLLYSAKAADGAAQPITAEIEVGFHPFDATGRMVYFGTGKYYEFEDQDPANAVEYNTMYGIWDRDDGWTITSVTNRTSNILQQQTVQSQISASFGGHSSEVREVSNTELRWEIDDTRLCNHSYPVGEERVCGWYLDLVNGGQQGEKMVGFPQLRGARLIFVTTIPSLEPCKAGGDGWVMALNPATGGRLDYPVWDLNNDGVFTDLDNLSETVGEVTSYTPVSGRKSDVGILQPPAIVETGDGKERWYSSGSLSRGNDRDDDNLEQQDAQNKTLTVGRKSWARIR